MRLYYSFIYGIRNILKSPSDLCFVHFCTVALCQRALSSVGIYQPHFPSAIPLHSWSHKIKNNLCQLEEEQWAFPRPCCHHWPLKTLTAGSSPLIMMVCWCSWVKHSIMLTWGLLFWKKARVPVSPSLCWSSCLGPKENRKMKQRALDFRSWNRADVQQSEEDEAHTLTQASLDTQFALKCAKRKMSTLPCSSRHLTGRRLATTFSYQPKGAYIITLTWHMTLKSWFYCFDHETVINCFHSIFPQRLGNHVVELQTSSGYTISGYSVIWSTVLCYLKDLF